MAFFEDGSYSCIPGITLIAKVLAGRCRMHYTRAAVGKGAIPEDGSPKTMMEPADYVMDAKISAVTNPTGGECQVTVQINSADVAQGFYATGILLYAQDPDEGEVPYTYLVLENGPEWIRPSSSAVGKLATFDLIAAVGDVDRVTASLDPDAIATLDLVEQMIAGATIKKEIIIPKEGWGTGAEDITAGMLYIDILQEDVTADMVPVVSLYPSHASMAKECGMSATARTLEGGIRFYSERAPDAEIHAALTLLLASSGRASGGGMGADYILPAATETRLGGVKVGKGIEVSKDGTISVDSEGLLDGMGASKSDVEEMLNEVFGSMEENSEENEEVFNR